jgi:hypothetical protein
MKYRTVEPRILIVSREIGSRPRVVILTVLRAVFIWGETDVIVPWIMVPIMLVRRLGWKKECELLGIPFFSSTVTVSFAHFIKNLDVVTFPSARSFGGGPFGQKMFSRYAVPKRRGVGLPDELHLDEQSFTLGYWTWVKMIVL